MIPFPPGRARKGVFIRKEAGYGGARIDLQAKLDGARIALQVDIGFGDAVTPAPEAISYPVLLDDLPAPQLRAYQKRWHLLWRQQTLQELPCAFLRLTLNLGLTCLRSQLGQRLVVA